MSTIMKKYTYLILLLSLLIFTNCRKEKFELDLNSHEQVHNYLEGKWHAEAWKDRSYRINVHNGRIDFWIIGKASPELESNWTNGTSWKERFSYKLPMNNTDKKSVYLELGPDRSDAFGAVGLIEIERNGTFKFNYNGANGYFVRGWDFK